MGTSAPKTTIREDGLCIEPKAVAIWAGATWASFSGYRTGFKHAESWRNKFKVKKSRSEVLTEEEERDFEMLTLVLTKPMVDADADQEVMDEAIRHVVFKENWNTFRTRAKKGQDAPAP